MPRNYQNDHKQSENVGSEVIVRHVSQWRPLIGYVNPLGDSLIHYLR